MAASCTGLAGAVPEIDAAMRALMQQLMRDEKAKLRMQSKANKLQEDRVL